MEPRKLIKFGNSSYVISIPKSWIKENKLKKGDLVYLKKNSGSEIIITSKEKNDNVFKKAVIHANSKDIKLIEREILAAYIKGFNILSIAADNINEKVSEIKSNLKNFIGVDIIEKNSKEIVVADFLDIKNVSLNSVIRKMDNSVRGMFDDLELCFDKRKMTEKEFDEIYGTDNEVNRFYFLLWKLTVYGLSNPSILSKWDINQVRLTHLWWLGMNVEKIGDELKRAAREFKNKRLNKESIKELLDMFVVIKKNYLDALNSYYKRNIRLAYNLSSKKDDIIKKCNYISANHAKIEKICEKLKSLQSCIHDITKCTIYFI